MVGTVGGGGRLEFTVIGDPVNVAARVEEATRDTGDAVLVTESTRALLSEEWRARLEERGSIPLKGKSEPTPLYALRREGVRRAAADAATATSE
jgi:class 3 adenylate cyclase